MIGRCDDLDPFFDEELPEHEAQAFRGHLVSCARCQKLLRGRMLEAMVVMEGAAELAPPSATSAAVARPTAALRDAPPDGGQAGPAPHRIASFDDALARARRLPAWRWRWPLLGCGALASVIALGLALPLGARRPDPLPIALAAERSVDVRFTAAALDHHRPLGIMRAAGALPASERIALSELAGLESRRDFSALVAAAALNGDLVSAERTARALPRSATSLSDRAAIELLRAELIAPGARPTLDIGAARSLSLATDALRIDPAHPLPQARWNQGLALERLGLSLAAARRFDEVAAAGERGWSAEASKKASTLRDAYRRSADDWRNIKAIADAMATGGPIPAEIDVRRAPSLVRDAFYKALAAAATPARLVELTGLARLLDSEFATTALSELAARVAGSDLRARAPIAAELAQSIEKRKPAAVIRELRGRAAQRDLADVALASFLLVEDSDTTDDDLAQLDRLASASRDPWWQLVLLARRAYVAEFVDRNHAAVDAIERLAGPLCRVVRSTWCWRTTLIAGGASSQAGRADRAFELLLGALHKARDAAAWKEEIDVLDAVGQAIANRAADDIDASAVGVAHLEEVALRKPTCRKRLMQLDVAAVTALAYHRFADAARSLAESDALASNDCRAEGVGLNAETARLRLVLHDRAGIATLRADVARLAADGEAGNALYIEYLDAGATLAEDPVRGEAALRALIARSTYDPGQPFAPLVRASAFDALTDAVARSSNAIAVLGVLADRLRVPRFTSCVLGVASWNRLVVAVLDSRGAPALETRDIPEGVVMIPPAEVVSPALRARLAGCRRVDVITSGPYFGAARLLGDDIAWVYHAGPPRDAVPLDLAPGPGHELVVSEVTPPEDLHLPALQPLALSGAAEALSGPRATPENVLAAMKTAGLVIIVAHGVTDANEPTAASLVLSPDARGDYLLTASKVSASKLTGSPVVILAGCEAGRVQVSPEPWSLATSFLTAGARVVIAPTEPIPDASANEVFRALVARIRDRSRPVEPVDALVAERAARGGSAGWLSSIVVFE